MSRWESSCSLRIARRSLVSSVNRTFRAGTAMGMPERFRARYAWTRMLESVGFICARFVSQ